MHVQNPCAQKEPLLKNHYYEKKRKEERGLIKAFLYLIISLIIVN